MTILETYTDNESNIEYKHFIASNGKHAIRVRDLDAEENIIVKHYPTPIMAKTEYDKTLEALNR